MLSRVRNDSLREGSAGTRAPHDAAGKVPKSERDTESAIGG
jgi:hypothetical protein